MQSHKQLLINDGYSEDAATDRINYSHESAQNKLKGVKNQADLERKLGSDWNDNFLGYALPSISDLAEFEFDAGRFVTVAAKKENKRILSTFNLLKYFDFWATDLSNSNCKTILEKSFMLNKPLGNSFAYYADKVFDRFETDPTFLRKISKHLQPPNKDSNRYPLPIFSFLKEEQLKRYFKKANSLIENPCENEGIISVRHVDISVGICPSSDPYFGDTLTQGLSFELGNVTLLYVGEDTKTPVAAVKWEGNPVVMGIHNVKNKSGRYPIISGGIYCTNKGILESAKEAYDKQGTWAKLNLERLPLKPMRLAGTYDLGVKNYSEISQRVNRNMTSEFPWLTDGK